MPLPAKKSTKPTSKSTKPTAKKATKTAKISPRVEVVAPTLAAANKRTTGKSTKSSPRKVTKKGTTRIRSQRTLAKMKAAAVSAIFNSPLVKDRLLPTKQADEFKASLIGSYKFSITNWFSLLEVYSVRGNLTEEEGMAIVGVETDKRYNEYRNFLCTGGFLEVGTRSFFKTELLDELLAAIKQLDYASFISLLMRVPSWAHFVKGLKVGAAANPEDILEISRSAFPTYSSLAEIATLGLDLTGEGIYLTNQSPSLDKFAKIAIETHKLSADQGGGRWVLTGLWLENISRKFGVHPLLARTLLEQAQAEGVLRYQVDSDVQIKPPYKKSMMYYLAVQKGKPMVKQCNLYAGDFLTEDKSSVSIYVSKK